MTTTRKLTLPVEVALHEPEDEGNGRTSIPMFFLIAAGTITIGKGKKARKLHCGSDGARLIIYLGDQKDDSERRALVIGADKLLSAFYEHEKGEQKSGDERQAQGANDN
jgi:hypothetical protein